MLGPDYYIPPNNVGTKLAGRTPKQIWVVVFAVTCCRKDQLKAQKGFQRPSEGLQEGSHEFTVQRAFRNVSEGSQKGSRRTEKGFSTKVFSLPN